MMSPNGPAMAVAHATGVTHAHSVIIRATTVHRMMGDDHIAVFHPETVVVGLHTCPRTIALAPR